MFVLRAPAIRTHKYPTAGPDLLGTLGDIPGFGLERFIAPRKITTNLNGDHLFN
jgi:hypothetical protein